MFWLAFVTVGGVYLHYLLAQMFVFAPQAILPLCRCPFYMSAFFGSHAPLVFPSSPSLPSAGQDGVGWSRDALVLLSEGFPLLPLVFGRAGRVEEPLVAHSVHGSSLLSPWFIRGLGIQELLSSGELLLPVLSRLAAPPQLCTLGEVLGRESFRGRSLFSVASPASSLHAQRGGGAGESTECRRSS